MSNAEEELKNSAKTNKTKSLAERAREAEVEWRKELRLSRGLHRRGNAMARERRRRAECPKESKAAVRNRRYRKKQLGKLGAASKVRLARPICGLTGCISGMAARVARKGYDTSSCSN